LWLPGFYYWTTESTIWFRWAFTEVTPLEGQG
jgi:hypothetical protein